VPADIVAAGKLNASITLQRPVTSTGAGPAWQGGGEVLALNVRSLLTNTRLALDKIPFTISSSSSDDRGKKPGAERSRSSAIPARIDPGWRLARLAGVGHNTGATVRGQVSRSGYNFLVQGRRGAAFAGSGAHIGLPAPQPAASERPASVFTLAVAGLDLPLPQ